MRGCPGRLYFEQQIVATEVIRLAPHVAIPKEASEGDVVAVSRSRLGAPDLGLDQPESNFMHRFPLFRFHRFDPLSLRCDESLGQHE